MFYTDYSTRFVTDFFEAISKSKNILITGHESPDADSFASAICIYKLLRSHSPEKSIKICFSGEKDNRFSIFENYDDIEFVNDLADRVANVDLLIMLDGGNFNRFSHTPEALKAISSTICIDHHSSKQDNFSLSLIIPTEPACVQMIYRLFYENKTIDKKMAEIILWGILQDTGNLTYLKKDQIETLTIVKKLLEISQVEIQEFISRYGTYSRKVFDTVFELIKNTEFLSFPSWPPFQYSYVDRSFVEKNKLTDNEIYEASYGYSTQYIRKIKDYTWGFVITPDSNGNVYISCRSLAKSVNVRDFIVRMLHGGGHDRASGGTFLKKEKSLDVYPCIKDTLDWIQSNTPVIDTL